jgi:hypothetical protein
MNNILEEYSGILFIPVILVILESFIKIIEAAVN